MTKGLRDEEGSFGQILLRILWFTHNYLHFVLLQCEQVSDSGRVHVRHSAICGCFFVANVSFSLNQRSGTSNSSSV